jgi:hypothetical protein
MPPSETAVAVTWLGDYLFVYCPQLSHLRGIQHILRDDGTHLNDVINEALVFTRGDENCACMLFSPFHHAAGAETTST